MTVLCNNKEYATIQEALDGNPAGCTLYIIPPHYERTYGPVMRLFRWLLRRPK